MEQQENVMDFAGGVSSNQSPGIDSLAEAFVKAQANISPPKKNREVAVQQKNGGKYTFKYTTLDELIEHVRKPLTDNGLWFLQRVMSSDGRLRIVTTLIHSSGQWISSVTPVPVDARANAQEIGSALTYMKRYSLAAMLGLESEEDDDANRAVGNEAKEQKKPKAQKDPGVDNDAFEKGMIQEIEDCKTPAELNRVWRSKKTSLDFLETYNEQRYGRILKAATEKKTALSKKDG